MADSAPATAAVSDDIVTLRAVVKDYPLGATVVHALRDVDLAIARGEFTVVAGPSGSGKTTLLNLVGCMDTATSGEVVVDGARTAALSDRQLTSLRLHRLGFIFQSFNLVPVLDVYQNVELPLLLQGGLTAAERRRRTLEMIANIALPEQLRQRPSELSGGQRQRVAIARALVTRPHLVLADEPTANLDSATGTAILELMQQLNRDRRTTFIFSTHDARIMAYARRIVHLRDGRVVDHGLAG